VLDEASSRLDPFTGQRIASATRSLLAGRTAVVIAHRLETLAEVDEIAVLENGRLVEHGDRARLAADADSRYARLLRTAEHGLLPSDAGSPALAASSGQLGPRETEEATA
jgi:ATP-binding cassette subfamily B protein